MHNPNSFIQNLIHTALLVSTIYTTSVKANFNNQNISSEWIEQKGATHNITDTALVKASDTTGPDYADFHSSIKDKSELWDVDFTADTVTVAYTSITKGFEYMYDTGNFIGFHFQNSQNTLPDFTKVDADIVFAPFSLDPSLIKFDANNIWMICKALCVMPAVCRACPLA